MHQAAKMLSYMMGRDVDTEELKVVAIFCGAGLLVALLAAVSLKQGFGTDFL